MKRRRRTDLWDDLFDVLRSLFSRIHPAWSIPAAAILFFVPVIWFQHSIKIPQIQLLGFAFGAILAVVSLAAGFAGWNLRRKQTAFLRQHVDIDWLNKLSWQDFERQVAEMYLRNGYQVEEVGGGGADGGVDLRIHLNGRTSIVQCKRWKTYKVGVKPVRELFGVMAGEQADRAIFITSGIYTDEALRFATGKPLELVDGAQLAQMLRQVQSSLRPGLVTPTFPGSAPNQTPLSAAAPARPKCPSCGSDMVLRRAKKGPNAGRGFWGCSTFSKTNCNGIREVE
jgi:restriction system protein